PRVAQAGGGRSVPRPDACGETALQDAFGQGDAFHEQAVRTGQGPGPGQGDERLQDVTPVGSDAGEQAEAQGPQVAGHDDGVGFQAPEVAQLPAGGAEQARADVGCQVAERVQGEAA